MRKRSLKLRTLTDGLDVESGTRVPDPSDFFAWIRGPVPPRAGTGDWSPYGTTGIVVSVVISAAESARL